MKVFAHRSPIANAITDYRITIPMQSLSFGEDGEPVEVMIDDLSPGTTHEDRLDAYESSDIVYCHAAIGVQLYKDLDRFHRAVRRFNHWQGTLSNPPAFVQDWDDLYTEVDFINPAFSVWGVTHPETGEPLAIGDEIYVTTADGERHLVWKDGVKTEQGLALTVARNHWRMGNLYKIMDQADLVTCTTPRLKQAIQDLGRTGPIYVNPNCPNLDNYPNVPLAPHTGIRVFWQGGYSHHMDLNTVKDSIIRVLESHPDVKMVFFGHEFLWLHNALPPDRYEYVPWVDHAKYSLKLQTIPFDIAIAPLEDTHFNSCKSAIKMYEAALRAVPAPLLAANVGPYADEIVDGETGMLYNTPEEFEAKLGTLIQNQRLRRALGENAKAWVLKERDATTHGRLLAEQFKEAIARRKAASTHYTGKSVNFDGVVSALNSKLGTG